MSDASAAARVRPLTAADAEALARLRRRALETDPHAFLSSPEDDFSVRPDEVRARLATGESRGDAFVLGAFGASETELVGMLGLRRFGTPKIRHKAEIWGVWVAPEARGRGVGRALLDEALERARRMPGLERVLLGVSDRSEPARRLYERAGFRRYATEPRAMKVAGEALDEDLLALELP